MGRRARSARRTPCQVRADEHAGQLSANLGKALREQRTSLRISQHEAGARAGLSQGAWSGLEHGAAATVQTWSRAAAALRTRLEAYLKEVSAAQAPRDAVQLRSQERILRLASAGGWRGLPEEFIDRDARTSRAADVLIVRPRDRPQPDEYGLWEVYDWFADVGAHLRDWQRRLDALERYAIARMRDETLPLASGAWVVRATVRNRALVRDHAAIFRARFAGSGHAWLAALGSVDAPMPTGPALLWVAVRGDRIYPARLG